MSFPRPSDGAATWHYIRHGVEILMVKDLEKGILTPEVYMNMYTAIHNFCVATQGPTSSVSRHPDSTSANGGALLLGGELYSQLAQYLQDHLASLLAQAPGENDLLVAYYNRCWRRYTVGARYIDHIFSYLNRHWVKHERDEGGKQRGIYEVSVLCLVLWRDHFFLPLAPQIVQSLLNEIERERNGEAVDAAALNECIQSMVAVGLDDQNSKRTNLLFYATHFEKPFLEATRTYYARESQIYLEGHGVVSYMRRVHQRLQEEADRVKRYLHPSTEDALISECESLLIKDHKEAIQNEFLDLLAANRIDDLHVLYSLLQKVEGALAPVAQKLESYVVEIGQSRINSLVADGPPDPRGYIGTLLDINDSSENLIDDPFDGDQGLAKAVARGCTVVINSNAVATHPSKTPELLAKFSDQLLKKSSRNAEYNDVNSQLDGIIRVLRFVEEKDAFEANYSRLLSRRLVLGASANSDLEQAMVTKLSDLCGFEYTNKLQRMFQDMATSADSQAHFKEVNTQGPEFQPYVLAEAFWPLPNRSVPFNLPSSLRPTFDAYSEFYGKQHSGRRLKWLWNFGKGEMRMNFAKGRYTLLVSIYQMAILDAFNAAPELDVSFLKQSVGDMPHDIFSASLGYIVKSKVLLQEPSDSQPGDDGTTYRINENFQSRKTRVNLNLPLKTEQRVEQHEQEKQLTEDRRMFLEACIVRIMKARRELSHAQLVEETAQQAHKRFQPTVRDIKRTITALLEKAYLRRFGQDHYVYIS